MQDGGTYCNVRHFIFGLNKHLFSTHIFRSRPKYDILKRSEPYLIIIPMRQFLTKLSLIFGTLALSVAPVMAQVTTGMEAESDDELESSVSMEAESDDEDTDDETAEESFAVDSFFDIFTEFSGLNAREYTADNVPTGRFGLWWKGVSESVSLAFTFNPVKKAEKHVRFAEERMRMAAAMMDKASDDPDLQDKSLKMIGKAQKFMDKVEDGKSKWLAREGEARENLLKNLGTHTALREAVFDRIEERLPEEALDKFQDLRDQGHMAGRRLMTALENESIPEEIRDHLTGVKQRVEKFSEDLEIFKDMKKELRDLRAQGEEGTDEALKVLREERKSMLRDRTDRLSGGKGELDLRQVFPDADELRSRVLDRVQENTPEFAPRSWILDRSEDGDTLDSSGEESVTRRRGDDSVASPPSMQPIIESIRAVPAPGTVVRPNGEMREGALDEMLVLPEPEDDSESDETSALEPPPPSRDIY